MKKYLFFVASDSDARHAVNEYRRLKNVNFKVICNFPLAFEYLKQSGIHAQDSQNYFPRRRKNLHNYRHVILRSKVLINNPSIKKQLKYRNYYLGEVVDYSLLGYLSEVNHSLMVAYEILRKEQPDVVYVSHVFTETPMVKYQSGNLNCENVALYELARTNKIKTIRLQQTRFGIDLAGTWVLITTFIKSITYSLKQSFKTNNVFQIPSLVILANHYQLTNLLPVINELKKHKLEHLVVGKSTSDQSRELDQNKIRFINFSSQIPLKSPIHELKIFLTLKYLFLWFNHLSMLRKYFSDPGEWPLVKWKLFYCYLVLFPETIETLKFADSIFAKHPKVLLTTATNDVFSKCFALSAKNHRVFIIELQHGLIVYDEEVDFRVNDIYAIWGKAIIPLLINSENQQNPVVTGFPYPNQITNKNKIDLDKITRLKLGLNINPKDRVLLVLAAFPIAVTRFFTTSSTYGFINTVIAAAALTGNSWTIIIRTHPSNNPDWIEKIPTPGSVKIKVDYRTLPLDQEIAISDLVIAHHTTALIQAILQNKPLALYLFSNPTAMNISTHPLITSKVAELFTSQNELVSFLNQVAKSKSTPINKQYSANFLTSYCSLPSNQVVNNIVRLCKKHIN